MWADANRRLSDDIANWVSFELLISDYDYFNANLLRYLGLKMSEERWKRIVGAPTNITRQFTFPPWQEWDEAQLMAFDNICGEQMARYGYASASASAD